MYQNIPASNHRYVTVIEDIDCLSLLLYTCIWSFTPASSRQKHVLICLFTFLLDQYNALAVVLRQIWENRLSKRYEYIRLLIRLTRRSNGLKGTWLGSVNLFNSYITMLLGKVGLSKCYITIYHESVGLFKWYIRPLLQ